MGSRRKAAPTFPSVIIPLPFFLIPYLLPLGEGGAKRWVRVATQYLILHSSNSVLSDFSVVNLT